MKVKLLPCPFCGKRPGYSFFPKIALHGIRCKSMGCVIAEVDEDTFEEAARRWNRRTPVSCPEAKSNPVTQAERDILNAAIIPPAPEADAWDRKRTVVTRPDQLPQK